jgi:hypothetical protein
MHGILGRASKEHVLDDRGRVASRKEKAYLSRFPLLEEQLMNLPTVKMHSTFLNASIAMETL